MRKKIAFTILAGLTAITVGTLLVSTNIVTFGDAATSDAPTLPPVKPTVPVITAVAANELFSEKLEALGTAKANESVVITPTVDDRVVGIYFEDGVRVKRGKKLIQLDDSEAQYLLAEARAAHQEQQKQFSRVKRLAKTKAASLSQLDEEKGHLEVTRARVSSLEARLQDYTIRAPFSGVLGTRQVSAGAVVDSNSVITTLDDITTIKLDFTIPEIHLGALKIGMKVSAHSLAYPDRQFGGEVTAISSRVDPETRALMIRARIPNSEHLLKPGMLLTVDLVTSRTRSLIIPEEAVIQEKDKKFVLLVSSENTVTKKEIAAGRRIPGKVEVISGLMEGDQVIIQGISRVRAGSTVNVVEVHNPGGWGA
ncbi:Probable Co/Zn/Cd efflux system membrane fusion protein [Olavius algarvensis Delta 1 endosymbiont]|nr:Probable Co/Zn/Cd efflux system membrane fusion protein [Olavius algarvensis Delta 1 endosymbiont]